MKDLKNMWKNNLEKCLILKMGGILKAQEGTGNLYAPHPLSPIGIALNQAKAMTKGKTHLPHGVKEVIGPDGNKVTIRTEQPLQPLEQSIAEWLPGTGDVAEVGYIADDVKDGRYGSAALAAGLMVLPGNIGKLLSKHRKAVSKTTDAVEDVVRKADVAEYINTVDDTYIDPVHLERVAKSEQITRFNKFAKKYGYPEITDLNISNSRLDELTKNMLERHNTYYRGVVMTPEVKELAKTLNISNEEALKIAATTPRKGESHIFVSPASNAGIYGGGTAAKIRRPYKLGSDRTKWFNEANFQIEPSYAYGGNPQAEVIYPWYGGYPEKTVPNELLLKKGEFIEWMNDSEVDDYVGSNNRIFSNYDRFTGLEFLPLEKFKQGGKL